jgi:hypothetical protein
MTIKQLIVRLLECDMDAEVTISTSNKDENGAKHTYEFVGVRSDTVFNVMNGKNEVALLFENWEFDKAK